MKSAQVISMWTNYAQKMVDHNVPLRSVAATMNRNAKHRTRFIAIKNQLLTTSGVVILTLPVVEEVQS